mmetsp:Transcript_113144/g.359579  ORF Transcript_113144/g.359579 Transcript_113144/m.359579 type:complete len:269 (-) Transcript_113144:102-908(-)
MIDPTVGTATEPTFMSGKGAVKSAPPSKEGSGGGNGFVLVSIVEVLERPGHTLVCCGEAAAVNVCPMVASSALRRPCPPCMPGVGRLPKPGGGPSSKPGGAPIGHGGISGKPGGASTARVDGEAVRSLHVLSMDFERLGNAACRKELSMYAGTLPGEPSLGQAVELTGEACKELPAEVLPGEDTREADFVIEDALLAASGNGDRLSAAEASSGLLASGALGIFSGVLGIFSDAQFACIVSCEVALGKPTSTCSQGETRELSVACIVSC